jgi:outer membrane receptor protein involved in Fe transport
MIFAIGFAIAVTGASARNFSIPAGDLKSALDDYRAQTGVALVVSAEAVEGIHSDGAKGDFSTDAALSHILSGTGFIVHHDSSGMIAVVRGARADESQSLQLNVAAATAPSVSGAALETVTVTSSKIGGDVQNIPIAITAMSQEQLTATQTAGGPDLVKQVPNLTFTKTNFTGYSIQIRGIGTQAISVTTDPAVAVAFNDIPFLRNHFFEQEFYDVSQVEVLRGPQGTLYGRNATAGVVNLVSAKPTDQYEAVASVDVGNYNNRRLEGMLNVPIVGDKLDLRVAGEWTKRDGYSFNETTDKPIDGRDLWSGRATIGVKPFDHLQIYAIWEHFAEDDDRMRSAKQLCEKDPGPSSVGGVSLADNPIDRTWLSQGCLPTSLYSKDAFETPNGRTLPFVRAGEFLFENADGTFMLNDIDPYASTTQSTNLRVIESTLEPTYHARNDTYEVNMDYTITPTLTLTSETGYNNDQLSSTEDYNRFNTAPGIFPAIGALTPNGLYCDPQLGCSNKIVGEDLSEEHANQFSQEIRLASRFEGPFNFSVGGNYLHYNTVEDYFVFYNLITAEVQNFNGPGFSPIEGFPGVKPGDFTCGGAPVPHVSGLFDFTSVIDVPVLSSIGLPSAFGCPAPFILPQGLPGTYIDPNPISSLDGNGHNYFRSENPYRLQSYAGFGEAYYQVMPDLKLTAGLRWTDDRKTFSEIPSFVFLEGWGYPVIGIVNQEWKEWTGRVNIDWSPKLDFTNQTLFYASYSRGYKGGGANPPPPAPDAFSLESVSVTHPLTFAPEFVNAYEIGTKNALLDGSMTLNGDVFYYDYMGYQISQIVDRTSINLNFDAKVSGAELEATWEPLPGLRFNFAGGLENSSVDKGQSAIDLIDRTAGHKDWVVVEPDVTGTANCILPAAIVAELTARDAGLQSDQLAALPYSCEAAYGNPVVAAAIGLVYGLDSYGAPFDPTIAPNNGAGFSKDLSGNKLPNTPPFTLAIGAQYSMPLSADWAATARADGYWQGNSFARIFNDRPYDQLRGYTNLNLSLIFSNQDGWQAMAYMKNVFNTTAITGAFLNSDDSALTTNVFVTDPRLFGLRITKNW